MFKFLRNPKFHMFYIAFVAWAIIIGLLVIFLSSAPAAPLVGDIRYTIPVINEALPQPVPYIWWDTSVWLQGWHDLMAYQHAIGVIDAAIAYEERQADAAAEIDRQMRLNDWREGGKNYILLMAIVLASLIALAVAFAVDKGRLWNKR